MPLTFLSTVQTSHAFGFMNHSIGEYGLGFYP